METTIHFTLNGKPQTVSSDPERPLLEVLREDLHLTGTKYGCGEGECRACTVMLNGESTPSCQTPIAEVDGQHVVTVEGLAQRDTLHPAQEAFLQEGAFQCGYCTAGMIVGAAALMQRHTRPTEADYLAELQHHICRCGSYVKYRAAIRRLATQGRPEKERV